MKHIIQEARHEKGMTKEELAEKCGTTKSYISKIENDVKEVKISTLQKIVHEGLDSELQLKIKLRQRSKKALMTRVKDRCNESLWVIGIPNKIMKIKILIPVFLIVLVSSCSTNKKALRDKYNYDSFILYDDHYIHNILHFENSVHSSFHLRGKIRSVHIIDTNTESGRQSSIKYYYNSSKEIERLTNYDEDLVEIMDRTYYHYLNYGGHSILKEGYSNYNPNRSELYRSSHFTKLNLVVLHTFENNELKNVDSIYYQDNFHPILIKHYDAFGVLQSINKIEYDNKKTSLNLIARKHGHSFGAKRVYNQNNKHLYVSPISNINFETLEYKVEKTKNEITSWDNENFVHVKGENDTLYYDSGIKCLIRKTSTNTSKTYFNQSLMPISTEYKYATEEQTININFTYNKYGDLESRVNKESRPYDDKETYLYKYDSQGNWIERKMFINDKLYKTTERRITYY